MGPACGAGEQVAGRAQLRRAAPARLEKGQQCLRAWTCTVPTHAAGKEDELAPSLGVRGGCAEKWEGLACGVQGG